nr:MAG TPA: hypothetical protein [Bacteriophage sp.]
MHPGPGSRKFSSPVARGGTTYRATALPCPGTDERSG